MALELWPTPAGEFTFLPLKDRACILGVRHVPRFDDLPVRTRIHIAEGMEDFWHEALDGPRYRPHSRECAIDVVEGVGYVARRLARDLGYADLSPHILEGDLPYFD